MKKALLYPLLALQVGLCNAQMARMPLSFSYAGIGAYSSRFADVFSFTANQAVLAGLSSFSAGAYSERRFMLQDLSGYQLAMALPAGSGNFGWSGSYSGNLSYNEAVLGLAYGRKLGTAVAIGAQFNYNRYTTRGYGGASAISMEAGVLLHLTERLRAGVHAYNPTASRYGKGGGEKLPFIYTAGAGYDVSDQYYISAEIKKEENIPPSVNFGMQYCFEETFIARGGLNSGSSSFFLGLGWMRHRFRLDAIASVHPYLGVTPGLLLVFAGRENAK